MLTTWLKRTLLPPVGAAIVRLLGGTMRFETRGAESVDALYRDGKHIILAFWHAQQLMIPLGYRGAGTHILISQHHDGELIARIVARFGHRAVRGSSTRGGVGALRALIRLGRSGTDLVVTPDGPKGPRQVAKRGVIELAKATGQEFKKRIRALLAAGKINGRTHAGFLCCRCGKTNPILTIEQ
ncbi:MAG: lysophospholipid acyltransferase family protein [Bacteroidota bacterium]